MHLKTRREKRLELSILNLVYAMNLVGKKIDVDFVTKTYGDTVSVEEVTKALVSLSPVQIKISDGGKDLKITDVGIIKINWETS